MSESHTPTLDDLLAPPPLDAALAMAPTKFYETIVLRFLARIINADGTIDPKELSMLVDVAIQLGMDGTQARRILDDELAQKSDAAVLAAQIGDPVRQREVYAMGCLMGATDGAVAPAEAVVLADFARGAQIPDQDAGDIMAAVLAATKSA